MEGAQQGTGGANRSEVSQAKVLQGACSATRTLVKMLINALKLLANQQDDGDSPIPNVVTGFHEKSKKKIVEVLRRFVEIDIKEGGGGGHVGKGHGQFQHL